MDSILDLINTRHHTPNLTRGVVDSMPCIYVDCVHCSCSIVWQPHMTARQVAQKWNKVHPK